MFASLRVAPPPCTASCPTRLLGINQTTTPRTDNPIFRCPGVVHIHTQCNFVKSLGYIRADAAPHRSKRAVTEAKYSNVSTKNVMLFEMLTASNVSSRDSQVNTLAAASSTSYAPKKAALVKIPMDTGPTSRNSWSTSTSSKCLGLYDALRYPTAWIGPPGHVPHSLLPSFREARRLLASLGALGSRHAKKVVKWLKDASLTKYYFS